MKTVYPDEPCASFNEWIKYIYSLVRPNQCWAMAVYKKVNCQIMDKKLQRIIADRKKWLIKESVQDLNEQDTAFVAEKYAEGIKPTSPFPKQWQATEREIKNGWKNSPAILSELVSALNEDEYVEDENAFMETMDNILEILKSRCRIELLG